MAELMLLEIGRLLKIKRQNNIYDFTVYSPKIASVASPGQIVNIKCGTLTLRRPISICDANKKEGTIRLCFDVKGKGTEYLSTLKPDDDIDMLGPLGKGYEIEKLGAKPLLCGGGIGAFPLYFTAKRLLENNADVTVALAFRNKELIIMKEDFISLGCKVCIATDDGSYGFHGFAAALCEKLFSEGEFTSLSVCGPVMMMKTACPVAIERSIPCFASLEERMGCGVGACLACVCDIKDESEIGFHRERVCAEGPVFDASSILWRCV